MAGSFAAVRLASDLQSWGRSQGGHTRALPSQSTGRALAASDNFAETSASLQEFDVEARTFGVSAFSRSARGKCAPIPVRTSVPGPGTGGGVLVDAEVAGDGVHVQEPKDEQGGGDHADECERNQDEARDQVGRDVSRATSHPSRPCEHGERFGDHRIRIFHAVGLRKFEAVLDGGMNITTLAEWTGKFV
jgi:hypothetical protein